MQAFLNVLNNIWPYAVAVILFLFMIFVHEFGHFIAARATGVRVNEFAIGFGPTLWKKQTKKTLYAIHLIPFGGFCAMEGEDEDSADSGAFCNKPAWKRLIIIIMGAVFNLVFGVLLVMITLIPTRVYTTTTVASFYENAVSCDYGLKAGDRIVEVDGRHIFTTYDLSYQFTGIKGKSVDMKVIRDGKKVALDDVTFKTEKIDDINYIAVDFYVMGQKRNLGSFLSQSFRTSLSYGRVVMFSLIDLIRGKYGISAVSGPVGVTVAIGKAAKIGLSQLLPMIALISINLGLFNLLPIPALDGSKALFLIAEMIIRKPVPKKFEGIVHTVGFIILIAFMLFVTAKDILSLF